MERTPNITNINDKVLIQKAASGNSDALHRLIKAYIPRVYRIAYQFSGNSDDARDISQELFMKIGKLIRKYKSSLEFSTWIYRITANLSIDLIRNRNKVSVISLHKVSDQKDHCMKSNSPDLGVERNELKSILYKVFDYLSEMQYKVIVLKDLEDFSTSEIAIMLDCDQSTVRVHLARARLRVKNIIKEKYPEFIDFK